MRKLILAAFVIFIAAAPAAAQDYKPFEINFGFGLTIPATGLNDSFDTGWNGAIGGTFNFSETLGVQAEYGYHRMGGPEKTISVISNPIAGSITNGLLESNHQIHAGTFNLVARAKGSDRAVSGYGLGGVGIYHRIVQITSPSVGFATYCDPYWYVCYPTAVSIDRIIGDRSSNDFGINFGGGITFGREAKFYVEARYHYVWGPTINNATNLPAGSTATSCASGCSTNAGYFPITFGVRW
jgi:opacity protein-like surface antigen